MVCFGQRVLKPARFALACILALGGSKALSQITNSGICNIIIQGNNNQGVYVQYCPDGKPAVELLDPPFLWLGMDVAKFKSLAGARKLVESKENGLLTIDSHGSLFGMPGRSKYGFGPDDKLAWMSVEVQCAETRDDYRFKRPPDLNSGWLEWRTVQDIRTSYEETTECKRILDVPVTLKKLFGTPTADSNVSFDRNRPSESEICRGLNIPLEFCKKTSARPETATDEFIGRDRLTGIGMVTRSVMMEAESRRGDYHPTVYRREIVGIIAVWGPAGKPAMKPRVYGWFHPYL